jgi:hypothetical protein
VIKVVVVSGKSGSVLRVYITQQIRTREYADVEYPTD